MTQEIEKLVGILQTFDDEAIAEAYEQYADGEVITRDVNDDERVACDSEDCHVQTLDALPAIERIIGDSNLLPAYFLALGARKSDAVARIVKASGGRATGFLVSPSLLLTNHHVFNNAADARKAKIQFNYQKEMDGSDAEIDQYTTDPDDFFYANRSLDFALVRVQKRCRFIPKLPYIRQPIPLVQESYVDEYQPDPRDPIILRDFPPRDWSKVPHSKKWWNISCSNPGDHWGYIPLENDPAYAVEQLVNIIQHPRARQKEVALQKNQVTHIYANHLRYKTDTQRGSSGSPVFNNQWQLIALHHAGGEKDSNGTWVNNQGVRIDKVIADLINTLRNTETGRRILQELGLRNG